MDRQPVNVSMAFVAESAAQFEDFGEVSSAEVKGLELA